MTEIMPVPRNLNFTVLPAESLARLFFDEGEDVSENFEIVSRNALILWRPDSSPQGHMLGKQAAFCDCAQVYSNGLEVL